MCPETMAKHSLLLPKSSSPSLFHTSELGGEETQDGRAVTLNHHGSGWHGPGEESVS